MYVGRVGSVGGVRELRRFAVSHRFSRLVVVPLLAGSVCCSCGGDPDSLSSTSLADSASTTSEAAPASTTTVVTSTTVATTTTAVFEEVLPETVAVSLSEPGALGVGKRLYTFTDPTRGSREVPVSVHYPALSDDSMVIADADPDLSGGPYPVVLGSAQMASLTGPHLASHGFVVIGGVGQSTWNRHPNARMVDYPLDLMVALDGMEDLAADDPLAGLADTSRSGVIDYSFGSWTALMLAGGRVNPSHYETTCTSPPDEWTDYWFSYVCGQPDGWDEMTARGAEAGVATTGELWLPMGDARIKAVMPMGPEGYDLVGRDGMAEISIPVLYVAAEDDVTNPYDLAAVVLFEATDPEVASMITLTDIDHFMIFDPEAQIQFRRFALAFFGYHLAGIADYGPALTKEFVENQAPYLEPHSSYETLTWGPSS